MQGQERQDNQSDPIFAVAAPDQVTAPKDKLTSKTRHYMERHYCVGLGGLCSFFKYYAMPAMLIYSIFMLVESTIMLNTMLTVVAKITKKLADM